MQKICPFVLNIIGGKQNFGVNQGLQLWYKYLKMMFDNPKVDVVNMNVYIKFGEILSSSSQDIEQKRNFGVNQGP